MIKGCKYGLIYFLIIPLVIFFLSKGDFSFLPSSEYFSKKYHFNFSFIYIFIFILVSAIYTNYIDNHNEKLNVKSVNRDLFYLRKKNKYISFLVLFVFLNTVINIFYIDHSVYWLDRVHFSFFPYYFDYYITPVIDFVIFISVIGFVVYIKVYLLLILKLKFYIKSFFWFVVDFVIVAGSIYNSGNRWWVALIFCVFFMFSSNFTQKVVFVVFPFLCIAGAAVSLLILSSRVIVDPVDIINSSLSFENMSKFIYETIILSTEGVNFLALLEVADISLFNPDVSYFFEKMLYTPVPGWLVEKPPVFNLLTSSLIY